MIRAEGWRLPDPHIGRFPKPPQNPDLILVSRRRLQSIADSLERRGCAVEEWAKLRDILKGG